MRDDASQRQYFGNVQGVPFGSHDGLQHGHAINHPNVRYVAVTVPVTKTAVAVCETTIAVAVPVTKVAVAVPVTKVAVAVPVTKVAVAVPVTNVAVAVPVANVIDAVLSVLPIVIVQSDVLREADKYMSVRQIAVADAVAQIPVVIPATEIPGIVPVKTVPDAVPITQMPVVVPEITVCMAVAEANVLDSVAPTKTAVAVNIGTSIRNHAVPSFAIPQSPPAVLVTGKKRLVADTVFGVLVAYLNVTVLSVPLLHAPV